MVREFYLIPMFKGKCRERCGISKFKICKMPVKYLSVSWREIHITAKWEQRSTRLLKDITTILNGLMWMISVGLCLMWRNSKSKSRTVSVLLSPLFLLPRAGQAYCIKQRPDCNSRKKKVFFILLPCIIKAYLKNFFLFYILNKAWTFFF